MGNTLKLPYDVSEISDGYHTFNKLYDHRHVLFINVLNKNSKIAFKTRRNDYNEKIENWFIAGLNTEFCQITYHLPEKYWLYLKVKEVPNNKDYDNHSSKKVYIRLLQFSLNK